MGKATILISTDLTEKSVNAIRAGVEMAKKLSCNVTLFHIHKGADHYRDRLIFPEFENQTHNLSKALRDVLEEKIGNQVKLFTDVGVAISSKVFFAEHVNKFSDIARDMNAKLLVIPFHENEFDSFFGGTVVEFLIRSSLTPVLVVKNSKLSSLHSITLPFAFQGLSGVALEFAHLVAESYGAKVDAVHFYRGGKDEPDHTRFQDIDSLDLNDVEASTAVMIKNGLSALSRSGLLKRVLLRSGGGRPKEQLLEYVQQSNPDLVVMGALGKSSLERLYLGSFCEYILRNSSSSLLIVKKH